MQSPPSVQGGSRALPSWTLPLVAGVIIRLRLSTGNGFYVDVDLFQGWTEALLRVGPSGFYGALERVTDYPPVYLYVLLGLGKLHAALGRGIPPSDFVVHLPAIASDVALAAAAVGGARLAKAGRSSAAVTVTAVSFVMLNPAHIMDSAVWGQFDALVCALMLAGLVRLALSDPREEAVGLMLLALAVLTKAQSVLVGPTVAVLLAHRYLRSRRDPSQFLRLAGVAMVVAGLSVLVIAPFRLNVRTIRTLAVLGAALHKDVSNFAWNLWAAWGWFRPEASVRVLGVPALLVALVLFGVGLVVVLGLTWRALERGRSDLEVVCLSAAAVVGLAFAVLTRMHERYSFYALGATLPLAVTLRPVRRWFAAASIFVTFNLVHVYWWYNTNVGRPTVPLGLLEATLFHDRLRPVLGIVGVALFTYPIVLLARLPRMPQPGVDEDEPPPVQRTLLADVDVSIPDATDHEQPVAPLPRPGLREELVRAVTRVWRDPVVRWVATVAIFHRIALQAIGLYSLRTGGGVRGMAIDMWSRWDAPHYLRLAEVGYRPEGEDGLFVVFFPFFPLAVRAASLLFGDLVLSGLVVSFVASVAACVLLYRLVRLDWPDDVARRTIVLLTTFPTGYYLAAPYTESLFLVGVVGAVYAARTTRWSWAATAGTLATGTRVAGLAVLPALALEAVLQPGAWRERARRLTWVPLAGLGMVVYLAINRIVHDDPFKFMATQRSHWYQEPVPPWETVVSAIRGLHPLDQPIDNLIHYWGRLAAAATAVLLLVAGVRKLRIADQVYAWGGLVLVFSASWLLSAPRYLLGLYPLFIVEAHLTRRRIVYVPVVAVGVAFQTWFMWRYARGAWTF